MAHASNSAVVVGVDNTHRRRFNLEEYAERACERQRREEEERAQKLTKSRGPAVQRKPLKRRTYQVYLESRLGQTQVLTPTAPLSQQAGYLCSDCNCIVKDSANFLDHINGKKHQSSVGMSMKVERATLEQVQSRFEKLKKQKTDGERLLTEQDLEERVLKQQEEEEERKRQCRRRKKEKKNKIERQCSSRLAEEEEEAEILMDPEVQAMMGFGGFSSSNR